MVHGTKFVTVPGALKYLTLHPLDNASSLGLSYTTDKHTYMDANLRYYMLYGPSPVVCKKGVLA